MGKKIDGITVAINGDTSGLAKSLKDVTSHSVKLSKNLKTVNNLLKLDPGNAELLAQKQKILAESIETTREKLKALEAAQEGVRQQFENGEIDTEAYLEFQRELLRTQERLEDLEQQADAAGDDVDNLGEQTEDAADEMQDAEKKTKNFSESLKTGLAAAAKIGAAAVAAVVAAVVAFGKGIIEASGEVAEYGDSIDKNSQKLGISAKAYQEWEAVLQHSGTSMEKMTASFKTLANAAQDASKDQIAAFEQLGLSMDEVSAMSTEDLWAAVISGLQQMEEGTLRTATANDLLGKGATELGALFNTSAEATQDMRDRVNELGGVLSDDAVKAAAAYQDSLQDMQTALTGTKNTIVASFLPALTEMMNGITEIASGGDGVVQFTSGMSNFVTAMADTVSEIAKVAQTLIPELVAAIVANLPSLIQSGVDIVGVLITTIIENASMLVSSALILVQTLANQITSAIPTLIPTIASIITEIALMLTDPNILIPLITAGNQIILGLVQGLMAALPVLIEAVPTIVENVIAVLTASHAQFSQVTWQIMIVIVSAVIQNLPLIIGAALELIGAMVAGIIQGFGSLSAAGTDIVGNVGNGIMSAINNASTWGRDLIDNFVSGIKNGIGKVISAAQSIAQTVRDYIGFSEPEEGPLSNFHTYAPDMIDLFTEGIDHNAYKIHDQFAKSLSDLNVAANLTGAQMGKSAGASASPIALNVSVNVGSIASDYDVQRMSDVMIGQISQGLEHLKMRQTAAAGGVW